MPGGVLPRDWRLVLSAAVGMVRVGFDLPWPGTLRGAWYVLRANQAWAPYPDNDPARARELMTRFYRLVADARGLALDPVEAARLEVDWWHEHACAARTHRGRRDPTGRGTRPAVRLRL